MSDEGAQLSNPFSTGGGGHNFENHVQAGFVVLMLTGGVVPCLPPWPIKTIKLQGKCAGYNTDDFIAYVEDRNSGQKAKLLAQIKHSISITENDETFGEVVEAAWQDFQNSGLFDERTDVIALITGPLSAHDIDNARTVLEWARHSENAEEFVRNVNLTKFSSEGKRSKLQAFRTQLKKANQNVDVTDDQLWRFLKRFHLLGYDLDIKSGVALSLLQSHIAQFTSNVSGLWASVAKEVESFNKNAGTITNETVSEEIREAFSERLPPVTIPAQLLKRQDKEAPKEKPDYFTDERADAIMLASLLGSWDEKSPADMDAIQKLIGDD